MSLITGEWANLKWIEAYPHITPSVIWKSNYSVLIKSFLKYQMYVLYKVRYKCIIFLKRLIKSFLIPEFKKSFQATEYLTLNGGREWPFILVYNDCIILAQRCSGMLCSWNWVSISPLEVPWLHLVAISSSTTPPLKRLSSVLPWIENKVCFLL